MHSQKSSLFACCFGHSLLLSELQILHQLFLSFGFSFALLCKLNLLVDSYIVDLKVAVGNARSLYVVGAGDDLLVQLLVLGLHRSEQT